MTTSLYPHERDKAENEAMKIADKWQDIFEKGMIAYQLEAVQEEAVFLVKGEDEQAIAEYAEHMAAFVENLPYSSLIIEKLIKGTSIK